MDGADTVDRQRRRQRGDYEEGEDELHSWYLDKHYSKLDDAWAAWHAGCLEIKEVGAGCGDMCPWCTGSHYENEEDEVPLTFWMG